MSQLFDHGVSTLVYLKNTKGILYLIYEPGSILHVIYLYLNNFNTYGYKTINSNF